MTSQSIKRNSLIKIARCTNADPMHHNYIIIYMYIHMWQTYRLLNLDYVSDRFPVPNTVVFSFLSYSAVLIQ